MGNGPRGEEPGHAAELAAHFPERATAPTPERVSAPAPERVTAPTPERATHGVHPRTRGPGSRVALDTASIRASAPSLPTPTLPTPTLPASSVRTMTAGVRALAQEITVAILSEIPPYREIATATAYTQVQRTVAETLDVFVRWLTGPRPATRTSPGLELTEMFRELGRAEALAGRSHDDVQSAYRIASRVVVRQLLEWERELPLSPERAAEFSSAFFDYLDELAEFSAQGFLDALGEGPSVDRERARLLALLLDPRGYRAEAVAVRAERLHWTVPATASLVDVLGLPDGYGDTARADLARALLGGAALAGRALGRDLIVTPERPDIDALSVVLAATEPGAIVVVGFHVPIDQVATSLRWIRRLAALPGNEHVPGGTVLSCEANTLALTHDAGRDVYDHLVAVRLAPLLHLSPGKRLKYGRLLSAWLELGSTRGDAPGVLDKHRQTLRYQLARIEELFGAQLYDREARVEMILALRAALPEWEREELGARSG